MTSLKIFILKNLLLLYLESDWLKKLIKSRTTVNRKTLWSPRIVVYYIKKNQFLCYGAGFGISSLIASMAFNTSLDNFT